MGIELNNAKTYTIKEASKVTGLPASTLRYYENIGIIRPIERDKSSKQRIYSENDMNILVAISCLSATGMSIDDMRTYLANRGRGAAAAEDQVDLLVAQRDRLIAEQRQLKIRRQYVELKIAYWHAVIRGDESTQRTIAEQAELIAKQMKR